MLCEHCIAGHGLAAGKENSQNVAGKGKPSGAQAPAQHTKKQKKTRQMKEAEAEKVMGPRLSSTSSSLLTSLARSGWTEHLASCCPLQSIEMKSILLYDSALRC